MERSCDIQNQKAADRKQSCFLVFRLGVMYISDYVEQLDRILSGTGKEILEGAGSVSHKQALEKAEREYQKYIQKNLSPVEKAYLETIKTLEKEAKTGEKK